jgi:5'-nucleotidase / UDP-sugar diphosphatase
LKRRFYPSPSFRFAFLPPLLAALYFLPQSSSGREAHLTLLFTNDQDGQVEPLRQDDPSKPVGGVARRMALIAKIRQEVGPSNVALVDSGDILTGTPFSDLTRGRVDCAAYELMGYDALALGEHDFDFGKKTILDYRREFKTPWISTNIVSGSQPFIRVYSLKYVGVRVGFIGFSDPDTPTLAGREKVLGLAFNQPDAMAKGLHSIFKKDADIFVVLSRLGVEGDEKLAKENPYLHVIIGGHSKTLLTEPIVVPAKNGGIGTLIVQAGSRGEYLGRLDLTITGHRDPKTKKAEYSISDYHYQLIPLTQDLPEDPQMSAMLQKYEEKFNTQSLAVTLTTVSGDHFYSDKGDCWLGETAADAMRKAAQTDVAFINTGDFHGDFRSGGLTRETLYQIYPVDEGIVTMEVEGSVLQRILEASQARRGEGAFLQVSGLRIDRTPGGLAINVGSLPLERRQKYTVAVNSYLAAGGAGYDFFKKVKFHKKTQIMIRDLLEDALKSQPTVSTENLEKRWDF